MTDYRTLFDHAADAAQRASLEAVVSDHNDFAHFGEVWRTKQTAQVWCAAPDEGRA